MNQNQPDEPYPIAPQTQQLPAEYDANALGQALLGEGQFFGDDGSKNIMEYTQKGYREAMKVEKEVKPEMQRMQDVWGNELNQIRQEIHESKKKTHARNVTRDFMETNEKIG